MDQRTVKRYISQQFVGYDRDTTGQPTREIWACTIEYTDGSTRTVIERTPMPKCENTLTLSPMSSYLPNRAERRKRSH